MSIMRSYHLVHINIVKELSMQDAWVELSIEFEKWRRKYINLEDYMEGNVFHDGMLWH